MPQFYKNDALELKFYNVASPLFDLLSSDRDQFFNEAYGVYVLGEMIFDSGRAPLSNAIPREIFRQAFAALFDSFRFAGSFEGYLSVFRQVFGNTVDVVFTVPAPGKLQIDINADGIELTNFIARRIENNQYVFDSVVDHNGDQLVFNSIKGLESEYELKQMLFEMVPAGIYTEITLGFGGA